MINTLKRFLCVSFALILLFTLTSCSGRNAAGSINNREDKFALPLKDEFAPDAPYGDSKDSEVYRASIYYASGDGSVSVPSTRVLGLSSFSSVERRLVEELMKVPGGDAYAVAPKGSRIAFVESAGDVVTVNVLPASPMSDSEIKTLAEAMSKTLFELEGVTGFNLLLHGRGASFFRLPIGLITKGADISALYDEAVHFAQNESASVNRRATGYFPNADETCLVPCEIAFSYNPNDPAEAVIRALGAQPDASGLLSGVPLSNKMFEKASHYSVEPNGDRILNIHLTSDAYTALKNSGHDRHMYLASIVLSVTSFLDETDGICLTIDGKIITEVPLKNGLTRVFPYGIMKREDFSAYIGKQVPLYFAGENNILYSETRALPIHCADFARTRILALMEGPHEDNHSALFPDGVKPSDILGVQISENIANVNFSSSVYRLMQSFTPSQEELFVYGLVNTLCELPGVSGVRLYFEGETGSALTHKVYLEGVLLKNPGRVQRSDISASN